MLDVGRLRFFNEVARAGSFTEAASRLSYTQSAVSQQIATLEAELGLTLIERGTRPLRLTDAGEVLLRHATSIFSQVATAQAELRAIAGLKTGIVRIAGFSSACATILPTAIATFVREHPNMAVTLTEMRPKAAHSALRAGDLDLAVTYQYLPAAPAHDDGLQRVWLGHDHLVMVLPVGHRLAHQQSLRLEHLHAEHWVSAPHSSPAAEHRRHLEERCARAGFAPHVRYEVNNVPTILGLIAAGVAVGLMPALTLHHPHPGIITRVPADDTTPYRHMFAVHIAQRRIPGVQPMLNMLQPQIPPQLAHDLTSIRLKVPTNSTYQTPGGPERRP